MELLIKSQEEDRQKDSLHVSDGESEDHHNQMWQEGRKRNKFVVDYSPGVGW